MLSDLRQHKVARVLFDEFHGEAWTIRPDVARKMHPEHPEDASYADAAGHLAERDFEVAANTDGPLTDAVAGGRRRARDRPALRRQVGAHGQRGLARCSRRKRSGPSRASCRAAAACSCSARPKQDKYGGNLNDLLAPFGIAHRERHRAGLPGQRQRARPGSLGEPAPGAGSPTLLHLVQAGRASTAPASLAADEPGAVVLRSGDEAQPARRRAPGRDSRTARAASWSSPTPTSSATTRIADLDHRQLWLNLVYWAALPAFARRPAADRLGGGARPGLGAPARRRPTRCAACRSPRARSTSSAHDAAAVRARVAAHDRGDRRPGAALPARDATTWSAWSPTCAPGSTSGCGKPDFTASLALFRPELHRARRHRAPGRLPHVHAQRLARHALRGAHRAHALAGVARRAGAHALRQRQVRAGPARRLHRRLRQRVRGALPRDGQRRRPADQLLRRHLLRPRGRALPPRRRGEAARHRCASTCRPTLGAAATSRRPRAGDLRPLGPHPRPLRTATATCPSTRS